MLLKLAVKLGLRSTEVYPEECLEAVVKNEMVEHLAKHLMQNLLLRKIKTASALFYCADLRLVSEEEWEALRGPLLRLLTSKDEETVANAEAILNVLNARSVMSSGESSEEQ
ncbi:hypothetical protein UFOVP1492_35 [uncultured Caudovirales phage]|uniref:Uncharacterized protein n=1 Tax=uncultured Caudovirales phage TaxID=2100421 RepID=A0A6J5QW22_9CAUD|nr:hypothetical protein UFOVP1127_99 [uncultured Caudovirales phage]CAB4193599.1 hypothetical protein UFOVP1242_111 [uncultured Caudovirales phage]CAB4217484.1 hypothetical protein UFOVP1492_35 [uncultured Caudovirales phage]CAB5231350.1 hypothetical protein UFOVP1580_64 [uncultured Caudovirales phage]